MDDWRPAAGSGALAARARLAECIRGFLRDRGVMEVETPLLSHSGNSDPAIGQFRLDGAPSAWLRTSPEYPMKRLLAAGAGDIYELGRVFRLGESGRMHNPEFTLLEWYRPGWPYTRLWSEAAELVNACGALFRRRWEVEARSFRDAFRHFVSIDPMTATPAELEACAQDHGIHTATAGGLDSNAWLDLLFGEVLQNALPRDALTVVYDFPASQAALARIRPGDPPVAERFELFAGGIELANGYQELTDPVEQRARFEEEKRKRRAAGEAGAPLDEHLLAALASGLPECSGVALGVDRLLMACLGVSHIDEVLAFPHAKA